MSSHEGTLRPPAVRCAGALKEWAVVNRALREGKQIFLLRKGGIVEAKDGFALEQPEFFLFPTYEHQSAEDLQAPYRGWVEESLRSRPPDGQIDFNTYLLADGVFRIADEDRLRRLLRHSVWSEAFLRKRLEYRPDRPMHLVFVRAYFTRYPHRLVSDPAYAGCTSWVPLKEPLLTARFFPVFSREAFEEKKRTVLKEIL